MCRHLSVLIVLAACATVAWGQKGGLPRPPQPAPVEASVLTSMPVKELAVFKDGHAFVLHESSLPTDPTGDIVIDTLPTPVLGTFWPYSADPHAKLNAVVAGQRKVRATRTALNVRELLEANPGADVFLTEHDGKSYAATIIGLPKWNPETHRDGATPPPVDSGGQAAPPRGRGGDIVLLRVPEGTKALPLDRVREVVFRGDMQPEMPVEESRRLMTLKLAWDTAAPGPAAQVGMLYLQKGVRWIPEYRVDIDGTGQAHIKLQATLINELTDFDNATVHLVVGVPSFCFGDMVDPMALQEAVAQLAQNFQGQQGRNMQWAMSNAIMSQQMERGNEPPGGNWTTADDGDAGLAGRHEDLFIFTLEHVSLRKGERMVVPVTEFTLPYEDVYVLDVPFAPPPEIERNYNNDRALQLARLACAPKVMHRIRLENSGPVPLTTAPAVILRDGRLIAQSLMTYTPRGGHTDLDLTTAVDVTASKSELEVSRTPNVEKWDNESYGKIDLTGKIKLVNHRTQRVRVEITRHVLGVVDRASHEATIEKANAFEDQSARPEGYVYPNWWYAYNWPYWWYRFNGIGRIIWKTELDPGQSVELDYNWHYYWR